MLNELILYLFYIKNILYIFLYIIYLFYIKNILYIILYFILYKIYFQLYYIRRRNKNYISKLKFSDNLDKNLDLIRYQIIRY